MSKAVLVMDMPENCIDCIFCREISECTEACCEIEFESEDDSLCRMIDNYCQEKPDWCPLRHVPDKKEKYSLMGDNSEGYVDGWNACIDDILGGAE